MSRDKQLKDLRMENENLRLRLERMERRVRNDTDSPQSSRSKEPRKRGLRDMSPGDHVPNKRIKQEVEDVKEPQAQQNCLPEDLDRTVRADIPKIPRIAELQDEILVESDDVFMRNKRSTGTLTEDSMEAEGDVKLTVSDKSIKLKRERPKQKKISKSCPLPMTSGKNFFLLFFFTQCIDDIDIITFGWRKVMCLAYVYVMYIELSIN